MNLSFDEKFYYFDNSGDTASNMTENAKYYQDWSESYRESARNVKDRIKELKKKLKTAQEDEAVRLRGSIMSLQESYYNCLQVADILKRKAIIEEFKAKKLFKQELSILPTQDACFNPSTA